MGRLGCGAVERDLGSSLYVLRVSSGGVAARIRRGCISALAAGKVDFESILRGSGKGARVLRSGDNSELEVKLESEMMQDSSS